MDYAGGANDYLKKHGYSSLNTKTDGSVTQRPLPDGRVEVTVVLHTQNALTFISKWDPNGAIAPAIGRDQYPALRLVRVRTAAF